MSVTIFPREEFVARTVEFVRELVAKRPGEAPPPDAIDERTLLFEEGYIDSLAILELIVFVEEALGIKVSMRKVVMKNFRTIEAIADTFWSEGTGAS